MSDNIKVVVKVRPLIARELEDRASVLWRARNNSLYQLDSSGRDTLPGYTFDKVYDAESETKSVYNDIARPIVEAATAGINGTIFAYGQTSSGKTYTMLGDESAPGIIPLAVHDIFQRIKNIPSRDFLLRVSYIEIYNETIKDLLKNSKDKIKVYETVDGSVKVDATEIVTSTPEEVLDIMKKGEANRQVGATNMNEQSSRSHTIFQITIESREHTEGEEEAGCVNVSQLNLVDLAGSERSGQTGATGQRFREGTHINKSLSALGLVIKQLSDDPMKYVNYRDSKLTRILQNSLGGNAKTSIICAITPAAAEETISTLQFANRAKAIKNKPEVNAVATNATMLQSLTKKLASLQYELDNKKHLEHDNEILMRKIEKLHRQILFGMDRPSAERGNRRKTWCAPRRATISALLPIQEESLVLARFCTPTLKYNSSLQPETSQFVTLRRASDIPEGSDEEEPPTTPPPARRKNVGFSDEVITLDDSEDEMEGILQTCSPYHKCYETSKTPPCVLREQVKKAEHNYNDLIELTEREKIYSPQTVELMDRLDKHSYDLVTVREELEKSRLQCEEQDKEIKLLKEKINVHESEELHKAKVQCEEKDKEISLLKKTIETYETEIQKSITEKVNLERLCASFKTRLTDSEVCLESCKVKFKQREADLLSLLEDKGQHGTSRLSDKFEKATASEISAFLNLSKDISLIDSEVETSVAYECSDKHSGNDNIKVLQAQIIEKNDLISELNKKIHNSQQSISMYKNELELLNSQSITQQENIVELKTAIDNLNVELQATEYKKHTYENMVCELKKKILNFEYETEQKLTSNNKEISDIIIALKAMLESKQLEIENLEADRGKTCSGACRALNDEKNKIILKLEEEIGKTKQFSDHNSNNNDETKSELLQINNDLLKKNCQLILDYDNAVNNFKKIQQDFDDLQILHSRKDDQLRVNNLQKEQVNLTLAQVEKCKNDTLSENLELHKEIDLLNKQITEISSKMDDQSYQKEFLTSQVKSLETEIKNKDFEMSESRNDRNHSFNTLLMKFLKMVQHLSNRFFDVIDLSELGNLSVVKETDDQEIQLNTVISIIEKVFSKIHQHYTQLKQSNLDLESTLKTFSAERDDKNHQFENEITVQKTLILKLNEQYNALKNENTEHILQIKNMLNIQKDTKEKLISKECDIKLLRKNEEKILTDFMSLKQQLEDQHIELQNAMMNKNKHYTESNIEQVEILKNEQNKLREILSEKENELDTFLNTIKQSKIDIDLALCEKQNLQQKLNEFFFTMSECTNIIKEMLQVVDKQTLSDNETALESIVSMLLRLRVAFYNFVSESKELSELKSKVFQKEKEFQDLKHACVSKSQEINRLTELNRDINNNLVEYKNFATSISKELLDKSGQIDKLYTKLTLLDDGISQKFTKYDSAISSIKEKIQIIRNRLLNKSFESLHIATKKPKAVFTPATLKELSLKCVDNDVLKCLAIKQTSFETQPNQCLQTVCELCHANVLDQLKNENKHLTEQIADLRICNESLVTDLMQGRQEVKLLLEPADHLHKQIIKHRSHLATLTATTHAENKLLKTRVKSLQHHHDRLHKVCQREIPELHEQLQNLQLILQNELNTVLQPKYSLSFSAVEKPQTVSDHSEITSNEISLSKYSATLDSDALMLETNFSLGPSANSTMINQEDMANASVTIICDNLDVTEIPRGTSISCQTDSQELQDEFKVDLNRKDDQKHLRPCCFYLHEANTESECNDTIGNVNVICNFEPSHELLKEELQKHSSFCVIKKEFHILSNLIGMKVKEIEGIFNTLNALRQEQSLEKKNHFETVLTLRKDITELQTENESLSTQVMDIILENDALKNEFNKMKNEKCNSVKCGECSLKDEIITNLKKFQDSTDSQSHTHSQTVLRESSKSNMNLSSHDIIDNNLRCEKICSLHNELLASREDCKKINEEVSTIRNHLSKNEALSMQMNKNLKMNSILECPVDNEGDLLQNLSPSKTVFDAEYVNDKSECLNFLLAKEICKETDVFDINRPIIDMMKFLFDTLWTKHGNDVDNLINKLKYLETDKLNIQKELNNLSQQHNRLREQLKDEASLRCSFSKKIDVLQQNNQIILQEVSKLNTSDSNINSKFSFIFSEKLLAIIDEEFSLSTSEILQKIMSILQEKYQASIMEFKKICADFEKQADANAEKLKNVNDKLLEVTSELSRNEDELVLLKSHKDRMYQISNAVTKDLLGKEKILKKIFTDNYQTLLNHNVISEGSIDTSLPVIEVIEQMFIILSIRQQNHEKSLLKAQEMEMELINENVRLNEKNQLLASELQVKKEELLRINSAHSELMKQIDGNDNFIKLLQNENTVLTQTQEKMSKEISSLKQSLSTSDNHISHLEKDVLGEALRNIEALKSECTKIKSLNVVLVEENKDLSNKLEIGSKSLETSKKEFELLNIKLEEVRNTNETLLNCTNELKQEHCVQIEELKRANDVIKKRTEELTLLEKNLKTHQKATDIQTSMYKRLQKEMEETQGKLKDKSSNVEQLKVRCETLQSELTELKDAKDALEVKITELQSEIDCSQKSCRNSLDNVKTDTRRRRQSVYDLQRTFEDISEKSPSECKHADDIFGSCPPATHMFSDSAGSQRNSLESSGNLDRRSENFPSPCFDNGEGEEVRVGGAQARRRRRQSVHDQHRLSSAHLLLGSKEDISMVEDLQSQNNDLKEEINRLKMTIENGPVSNDYYKREISNLKSELESYRSQLVELQRRFDKLDEECETCRAYLRERDEQNLQLTRIKKVLELQLTEMSKRLGGGDAHHTASQPIMVHVAVNTDDDGPKRHSTMVDRMSYDAETEKNKKLAKAVEELRIQVKNLKSTIAEVQEQIAVCGHKNVNELERLKSELERCLSEHKALQRRFKEVDEECDTCGAYLAERDEQNLQLTREKKALETKLTELQKRIDAPTLESTNNVAQLPAAAPLTGANSVAQSTRKKRQSCHDMNREPDSTTAEAATNTDGGALSALGVDHMTHDAEKERRRRLQAAFDTLKARYSELSSELRRLQNRRCVEENTVEMLKPTAKLEKDLQWQSEMQRLRAQVEELMARNAMLEQHSQSLLSVPPSPAPGAHASLLPPTILVSTGSAIVQSQQLCDFIRENERLKKLNKRLVSLCKKRGKPEPEGNRENVEPQ